MACCSPSSSDPRWSVSAKKSSSATSSSAASEATVAPRASRHYVRPSDSDCFTYRTYSSAPAQAAPHKSCWRALGRNSVHFPTQLRLHRPRDDRPRNMGLQHLPGCQQRTGRRHTTRHHRRQQTADRLTNFSPCPVPLDLAVRSPALMDYLASLNAAGSTNVPFDDRLRNDDDHSRLVEASFTDAAGSTRPPMNPSSRFSVLFRFVQGCHQAVLERVEAGADPVGHADLVVGPLNVVSDGLLAQDQLVGDLPIREPAGDQAEDLGRPEPKRDARRPGARRGKLGSRAIRSATGCSSSGIR